MDSYPKDPKIDTKTRDIFKKLFVARFQKIFDYYSQCTFKGYSGGCPATVPDVSCHVRGLWKEIVRAIDVSWHVQTKTAAYSV
jgi:hypothetical protein